MTRLREHLFGTAALIPSALHFKEQHIAGMVRRLSVVGLHYVHIVDLRLIDHRNLNRRRSDFPILPTRKLDRHSRLAINRCVWDPHGAVKAILSATLVERRLDMDHPSIVATQVNAPRMLIDDFPPMIGL